ncbi:MAG: tRNA(His) guanylyltransferase Thg1 family protein [Clostridia bacterium]|nr:tRNA(His) guanylyltransferase Thg1 family protein [Clostridia bacterium]
MTLGERMKKYEGVTNTYLVDKVPVIIRLDGRAFHTLCRGFTKPFDEDFSNCMTYTLQRLCEGVGNCVFGYTQSDEITLVLYETKRETEGWFDNRVQKIASISASMATLYFNEMMCRLHENALESFYPGTADKFAFKIFKGVFDARVFNIPKEEVVNNIIWRQWDATKNSINAVAQANFSHKELQGKNGSQLQDMLMSKGINWNDTPTRFKRGIACIKVPTKVTTPNGEAMRNKWTLDYEMPILTQSPEYVTRFLEDLC